MLLVSCGKKVEERAAPARRQPAVRAPAGMIVLPAAPGSRPAFMETEPVKVQEYCQFLEAIGLPLPDGPGAGEAARVTGLTVEEARRFAAWKLRRLPTRPEWESARGVVGAHPYCWTEDVSAAVRRSDVPLYLVQDWLPGTPEERQAVREKQDVLSAMLEERLATVGTLREELSSQIERSRAQTQDWWRNFKPEFFSLIELQKESAELKAGVEGKDRVLKVLQEIGRDKTRLIHLKTCGATRDELELAADQYQQLLADILDATRQSIETVEGTNQSLQQEVIDLSRKVEQQVEAEIKAQIARAEEELRDSEARISSLKEAFATQTRLEAELDYLRKADDRARTAEQVKAEFARLESDVQKLPGAENTDDRIRGLERKLENFSRHLERQFLQEKALVKALLDLSEKSVRLKALRKKVEALEAGSAILLAGQREAEPEGEGDLSGAALVPSPGPAAGSSLLAEAERDS